MLFAYIQFHFYFEKLIFVYNLNELKWQFGSHFEQQVMENTAQTRPDNALLSQSNEFKSAQKVAKCPRAMTFKSNQKVAKPKVTFQK